jgi:hypothetical protein
MSKTLVVVLLAGATVAGATGAYAMGGSGGGGGGAAGAGGGAGGGNWQPGPVPANDGGYATPVETTSPVTRTRKKVPSQ